jgi:hypothetical protein
LNWIHAKNYWRATFERESDGKFSKADFDRWFAKSDSDDPVVHNARAASFTAMLEACRRGEFGDK